MEQNETNLDMVCTVFPPDAGRDVENPELLYKFEDLEMGWIQSIYPDVIETHHTPSQNQYTNSRTRNCCSVYGLDHTRRNSVLEGIDDQYDALEISLNIAIPSFPSLETSGWSMTGVLQLFKNRGLIKGYAIIDNTPNATLQAIWSKRAIFTGSIKIDWAKTAKNNSIAVLWSGTGHLFCVDKIRQQDEMVDVHDSSGPTSWDGSGHFKIPFELFYNHCYTKVILLNENEAASLQEITDKKTIEKAIQVGITNGDNLDVNITRQQAAVMIVRAMEGQNIDFDTADQMAIDKLIYNGLNKDDPATRGHIMLMVASMLGLRDHSDDQLSINRLINAGITNGMRQDDLTIRRDAILLITRAYIAKNK